MRIAQRPARRGCSTGLLVILAGLACAALLAAGGWGWLNFRPQPRPESRALYPGITYTREARRSPRPMVIHVVSIDLRAAGTRLLVTPGDVGADRPLRARTTGDFLEEFGVQVAINGDGFTPWVSNNLLDYYPRPGDPVTPVGFAASEGKVYAQDTDGEPTLYLSRANEARFGAPGGKVYNALSGNLMLIEKGQVVVGTAAQIDARRQTEKRSEKAARQGAAATEMPAGDPPQPRTALALDRSGRRLILVVVDGRQPNYSEGATLVELAEILLAHGGYTGMNLDGGGSSTLVIAGANGKPVVLNSPVDQGLPGRQRPVGNHLGIFAPGAEE